MNKYDVVIGIEIHIELNTKTKMFSCGINDFSLKPNSFLSPTDLAYPGTLPQVNKQAIVKAIKLAKALNMTIDDELHFDRKNYFYFDLPKGFQITQERRPIAKNGFIKIGDEIVKIAKFHLEEDTAKTINENNKILLNYNRSGVPLIEIVTDPVIFSSDVAVEYIKNIQRLAIFLNISDAKMEEGSLRADINISLKNKDSKTLGTKVEIKNLNSLNNIKKAIDNEIILQSNALDNHEEIIQATKRFDENSCKNILMRVKHEAADYKYFPEPNIVPIKLSQEFINSISIEELPWEKENKYTSWEIEKEYINQLLDDKEKVIFFESIKTDDYKMWSKIFFSEIVKLANSKNISVNELNIKFMDIQKALSYLKEGIISGKQIKEIILLLEQNNSDIDEIMEKNNMKQISDEKILSNLIENIISQNENFISQNKDRIERVEKFIIGLLMKETSGQANPIVSIKILKLKLEKV